MTSTVLTDPPALHAELEAARQRSQRANPACPRCGRKVSQLFFKPNAKRASRRCTCGEEWTP